MRDIRKTCFEETSDFTGSEIQTRAIKEVLNIHPFLGNSRICTVVIELEILFLKRERRKRRRINKNEWCGGDKERSEMRPTWDIEAEVSTKKTTLL